MDGPSLNKRFNELFHFWKSLGEDIKPECDNCHENISGKKVIEILNISNTDGCGFWCMSCALSSVDPSFIKSIG